MTDPTGTWRLVLLGGSPPARHTHGPVTLTFDGDGMLYGMAGVNRVRATWAADEDDQLAVGPIVSTMMAGPADAMATERALLALLSAPLAATVDDGGLRLVGEDGSEAVLVPDEAGRA
jgi:heat shock protein HslJ